MRRTLASTFIAMAVVVSSAQATRPREVFMGARAILVDASVLAGSTPIEGISSEGLREIAISNLAPMIPAQRPLPVRAYDGRVRLEFGDVIVRVNSRIAADAHSGAIVFVATLSLYRTSSDGRAVVDHERAPAITFLHGTAVEMRSTIEAAITSLLRANVVGGLGYGGRPRLP